MYSVPDMQTPKMRWDTQDAGVTMTSIVTESDGDILMEIIVIKAATTLCAASSMIFLVRPEPG